MIKHTIERSAARLERAPGRRILSIGLLALLGLAVACKPKHDKPAPPPATPAEEAPAEPAPLPAPAPEPVAAAPSAAIEVRPSCDQFLVTENGAAAVQMGDARDSVRARCNIISDSTTADADGVMQGRLVVGVNGSTLEAQVANGRVNGIFVTDPQFRTTDGFSPGMPLTQVMQQPGAVVLEGQHDLSIVVSAHCGLYFQIPKPDVLPQNVSRWTDVVASLPPSTTIQRVVVRGCR